jgi:hypothetical protein
VGRWGVEGEGATPVRCTGVADRSEGGGDGKRWRNQEAATQEENGEW